MAGSTNSASFDCSEWLLLPLLSEDFFISAVVSFLMEVELAVIEVSLFFSELRFETLFRFFCFDFGGRVILFRFSLKSEPSSCMAVGGKKPRFVAAAVFAFDDFPLDASWMLLSAKLSAKR